jgi:uncharacterized repeat protein (TIGR01451 family)
MALFQSPPKMKNLLSLFAGSLCFLFLLVSGQAAFAAADVQPVTFLDNPDPVAARGIVHYTIDVHNNHGADAAVNPSLVLTVPLGFSFVSVNDGNCSYSGASPSDGSATVTCSWGSLAADTSYDIDVDLRASDVATTYNLTATATSDGDGNNANESETNITEVIASADLVLANKSSVPEDTVFAGGILTYKFEVRNDGPDAATNLILSDQLPVGLTFFADNADPAADDDGIWTCTASGQDVSCTSSSLANGDTTIFYFRVKVTTDTLGNITNTASVTSDAPEPDPNNNTDTDDIEILAGTDLSIAKTVDTQPAIGGQPVQFTVTVTNEGPLTATNIEVIDSLPSGYSAISATPPGGWNSCTVSGTEVTCINPGNIVAGGSAAIVITATPLSVAGNVTHQNSATVTTDTTDPIPNNDSVTVNYTVSPDTADLSLSKSKSPNPVAQGSDATSTITVVNNGPRAADTVQVVDVLSLDETYSGFSGTNWTCTPAPPMFRTVTCNYAAVPLANGAQAALLTITTTATNAGILTNTACTGGQGGSVAPGAGDSLTGNNCNTGSVLSTTERADLVVTKVTDDAAIDITESSFTYTVTVHNNGPDTSASVDFTDTIPQYVSAGTGGRPATLIAAVPSQGSCTETNALVECALGDIVDSGDVTVAITVTRPMADGLRTNTASAYSTLTGDPDRSNNSDDAVVTVTPITDIEVTTKTVTYSNHPDPILAGTIATYSIQVRNNGPSLAQTVQLADVFTGEAFTFIDYHVAGSGSCSFDVPSKTLNCNLNDMAANTTKSITVEIRPDHLLAVPDPWEIDNTATVTMVTEDSVSSNNDQSLTLPIQVGQTDLTIEKNESPDFIEPVRFHPAAAGTGNRLVYEMVITNNGPSLATGVTFIDNVTSVSPSTGQNLQFIHDTENSDGSVGTFPLCSAPAPNPFPVDGSSQDITCLLENASGNPLGQLASGASYTRYLVFEVLASPDPIIGDVYHDHVVVSANEVETSPANNAEDEKTTVRTEVDLGIVKDGPAGLVEVEENFDLTLTITNHGPGVSPQTTVTDNLPSGMVLTAPPTPTSGTCTGTAGSTSFTCDLATMANAATISITVPVKLTSFPSGGTITNTASVSGLAPEPVPDDTNLNTDDHVVTVYQPAVLGNLVWLDRDADGIQDGGEPGIAGVTVNLLDSGGGFLTTTTTNGSGLYSFTINHANDYILEFIKPLGYLPTPLNAGGNSAVDSNAALASGKTTAITVAYGSNNQTIDAGMYQLVSLGDRVWLDDDADGLQDAGELGMVAVTVNLLDDTLAQINTTTTDATGNYQFTDLEPGDYSVQITPPTWPGYLPSPVQTPDPDNNNISDSNIDVSIVTPAGTYQSGAVTLTSQNEPTNDGDNNNTNSSVDFGLVLPGSVGNFIWLDENSDGIQDAGEPGIANVTVHLKDATTFGVIATTLTDSNGGYLFKGLAPGNYLVAVDPASLPPGMTQTVTYPQPGADFSNQNQSGNGYGAYVTSAGENLTADFGYNWSPSTDVTGGTNSGALGDRIWIDSDGDGIQDADEVGVSGAEVTLYTAGPDNLFWTGDDVLVTTTTNASGNYIFDNLAAGAYAAEVTDDSGASHNILNGTDYSPSGDPDHFAAAAGTAPAGTAADNKSTLPVILAPGDTFVNVDFGYQPQAAAALLYTIGDTVWIDANRDGIIDGDENKVSGVTIGLKNALNEFFDTTTTNAQGEYLFENLPDGTYTVVVIDSDNILAGFNPTYDQDNGTTNPDEQSTLTLAGANDLDQDFGYAPNGPNTGTGMIGDTIFLDRNGNGTPDEGEGIEGVRVLLRDQVSTDIIARTYTDANGMYFFGGLPADDYTVDVDETTLPGTVTNTVDPDAGNDSESALTLIAAEVNLLQDFGYVAATPGSIGDFVWKDTNADGEYQPNGLDGSNGNADDETAFVGVTIDLYLDSDGNGKIDPDEPKIASTVTNASGNYLFERLPGGDYNVKVTDTANILTGFWHSNGTLNANNNSQVDYYSVTLPNGGNILTADFGYYAQPGSVGDLVWKDVDGNGVYNVGDTVLNNITVFLDIEFPDNTTITLETFTDSNGLYLFPNLLLDENHNGIGTTYGSGGDEPLHTVRLDETDIPAELTSIYARRGSNTDTATPGGAAADEDDLDMGSDNPGGEPGYPPMGSTDITNDFGYFEPSSIGEFIWHDLNNNGVFDAGEALNNITVRLTPPADVDLGSGLGIAHPTTTDANGHYLFEELPHGSYTVTVDETTLPVLLQGNNSVDPDGDTNSLSSYTLAIGENERGRNFAYFKYGSISNYVWNDADADGIQDIAESGVQGVTVTLYNDTNTPLATDTTDASGLYNFPQLFHGNYYLIFSTLPTNFVFTPQNSGGNDSLDSDANITTGRTEAIVLNPGVDDVTWDSGIYELAAIGDTVWDDTNGDGIQNNGETGISGITVTLYESGGAQVGVPATTNGTGNYNFSGLAIGDYYVTFTLPSGYEFSSQDQGGDNALDSDADTTSGSTTITTLVPGENDISWDAGIHRLASIGDTVWNDTDADGIQNNGETGVSGLTVTLYESGGAQVGVPATTNGTGNYNFTGLAIGDYYVTFTHPSGYEFSSQDLGGNDTLDSDANPITGRTTITTLVPDENDTSWDAGIHELGSIGDTIWNDKNNNGLLDPGEALENITVILTPPADVNLGNGLGIAVTMDTNASGHYLFENVSPGAYTVQVDESTLPAVLQVAGSNTIDPDGGNNSTATLTLGVGMDNLTQDFAYFVHGTIGNYVWDDTNGNGLQDGGESGHQGIRAHLLDGSGSPVDDPLHPGTPYILSTGAAGEYLFENLLPGSYRVQFILPAGTITTSQNSGADGIDSDPDTAGLVTAIVLVASGSDLTIDAGLIGPAINIEKSTNTDDADVPPGISLNVDDPITWTYLVTNTGNVTLTQVRVTDDKIGIISCPQDILAAGASMTCTANGTAVAGQYANTGSVIGSPPTGPAVIDSDPSHYLATTPAPAVDIEKSTNGEDADTGTGPVISIGDLVNWVYLVTNTGNVALTSVTVTDNMGVVVSCPQDTLAVDESMTCTASENAVAGQYENIGTVVGTPSGGGASVSDTDYSHYFGSDTIIESVASVDIEKATNGVDADSAPGPYAETGHTVTWTYVVTNNGNVDLSDVTVSDDQVAGTDIHCPDDGNTDNRITLLPVGASVPCTATGTATPGSYENTGSVIGTPPFGPDVTDTDLSHYFGSVGAIDIEKATNGEDADTEPGPTIKIEEEVNWTYVVTNIGHFPLTNVEVTDDQSVDVSCPTNTLAIAEVMTCTGNGIAVEGQYKNIGSVTGETPNNDTVQDTDPSHYLGKTFLWYMFYPAFIPTCPPVPDYCYLVADGDNITSTNSALFKYTFPTDSLEMLNRLGVDNVETITLSLDGRTLYAADNGVFGIIDPTLGIENAFMPIEPAGVGLAGGALGVIDIQDIDGLSFDPITGILYGSVRYGDGMAGELDLLIQINPERGRIIEDAFGAGVDYVVINTAAEGASDVDDIAIDSDGTLFGIAGNSGGGGGDRLVIINKQTGAVGDYGPLNQYGAPIQDMEGLTLYNTRVLYGTTGYEFTSEGTDNILYKIDKASGETVPVTNLGKDFDGYVPKDFEAISCFPICK